MADPTGVSPQFWLEWSRVTRFMESSRIAFTREASLWNGLELKDGPSKMKLLVPTGKGKYSVTLEQHLETLADQTMLFAGVLMHSYARAESAAADKLGVDLRRLSGIEDWGSRLLEAASASWTDVPGDRAGAVEVAVVRAAFAHGTRRVDRSGARRLEQAGVHHRPEGSPVTLSYEDVRDFRECLRKLLNLGQITPETASGGA